MPSECDIPEHDCLAENGATVQIVPISMDEKYKISSQFRCCFLTLTISFFALIDSPSPLHQILAKAQIIKASIYLQAYTQIPVLHCQRATLFMALPASQSLIFLIDVFTPSSVNGSVERQSYYGIVLVYHIMKYCRILR